MPNFIKSIISSLVAVLALGVPIYRSDAFADRKAAEADQPAAAAEQKTETFRKVEIQSLKPARAVRPLNGKASSLVKHFPEK